MKNDLKSSKSDIDDSLHSIAPYIRAVLGRKADHVVALDVRKLTSFADVFIICSGRSNRQVSAIGEYIHTNLKKQGIKPLSVDGMREGQWVLLDYGHVLIHVFYDEVRRFYDLEGLWTDAGRIDIESIRKTMEQETSGEEKHE